MLLLIKTAIKVVKDKSGNVIPKGERYLQVSNGTIGAGARASNYSKEDALKMFCELSEELLKDETRTIEST